MAVYKYCLDDAFHHATGSPIKKTISFRDQDGTVRLQIDTQGVMTVYPSYAWDGCSPKIRLFDWGYLGIPDGTLCRKTGKPKTYYASLVHDTLCQFADHPDMPFSRKQMDLEFYYLLKQSKFSLAEVYYLGVRLFGGAYSWVRHFFS